MLFYSLATRKICTFASKSLPVNQEVYTPQLILSCPEMLSQAPLASHFHCQSHLHGLSPHVFIQCPKQNCSVETRCRKDSWQRAPLSIWKRCSGSSFMGPNLKMHLNSFTVIITMLTSAYENAEWVKKPNPNAIIRHIVCISSLIRFSFLRKFTQSASAFQ